MNSLYTDPHQKKLLAKWKRILESGTPIENENTKVVLAQVLENTRNFYLSKGLLNEAGVIAEAGETPHVGNKGTSQSTIVGKRNAAGGFLNGPDSHAYRGQDMGDFYLPNVVMPMLRRIMPDLIANELVSVQPLNGPVGFALAYRPLLGQNGQFTPGLTAANEIGYNPTDTRWTGQGNALTAVGGEGSLDIGSKFWQSYGGEAWLGEGKSLDSAEWATLGYDYPTVSFGLMKSTVEAKTRKLAAHWSPELAEDMQAMHGIDVEREMVNTLTYEVGAEIDRQIVTEMVKAAIIGGSVSEWTPLSADGLDQMGRLATLLTQITIEANQIAIKTKRGSANFVITTPRICALLEQLSMNKFTTFKTSASIPSVPDTGVGALTKVGMLNNDSQLLIRDAYVQAKNSDYILMGYKGKQNGDSGLIYMPYVPLQLNKIMQPDTFSYSIGARTRYGIMSNPWDAKNYYHFMRVTDLTGTYAWNTQRQFIATPSVLPGTPKYEGTWNGGSHVMPEYNA
jgi:hypothetical protein